MLWVWEPEDCPPSPLGLCFGNLFPGSLLPQARVGGSSQTS